MKLTNDSTLKPLGQCGVYNTKNKLHLKYKKTTQIH